MIQNPQMVPQQTTPGASAVNIQIFNPQAYGHQNGQQSVLPQNLDTQLYNYPQTSLYQTGQQQYGYPMMNAWGSPVQMPAPQYMPQASLYQQGQPYGYPPVQMPAPQVMPQAILPAQNQQAQAPQQQAPQTPQVPEMNQTQTNEPNQPQNTVDLNALNAGLQSQDVNAQTEAITKIAQISQETPDKALQVVDNGIMQSLIGIIQKDTSTLEGPSQQQLQIAEKMQKGEQVTPEEQAVFEQSSPREIAEKNKVFGMFALAMLQKLQRDEIDNYNKQTPNAQVQPIKLEDLAGYNEILNTLNTTQIPAVKIAAIQALSYVARPEDQASLEAAIGKLVQDPDVSVQEAAKEALGKVQGGQQAPADAQAQIQQPAPNNNAGTTQA